MSSENIATIIRMIESLPETTQNQIIEHLREYIANLQNEREWDNLVSKTQNKRKIATDELQKTVKSATFLIRELNNQYDY